MSAQRQVRVHCSASKMRPVTIEGNNHAIYFQPRTPEPRPTNPRATSHENPNRQACEQGSEQRMPKVSSLRATYSTETRQTRTPARNLACHPISIPRAENSRYEKPKTSGQIQELPRSAEQAYNANRSNNATKNRSIDCVHCDSLLRFIIILPSPFSC